MTNDCAFFNTSTAIEQVGGPINTYNGNYDYRQSIPDIATSCEDLRFEWIYNSLNSGGAPYFPTISSTLGVGWTHNYNLSLEFSDEDEVIFHSPSGNSLAFEYVGGKYWPPRGVWASLTQTEVITGQHVYTLTSRTQTDYVFDDAGRLLQQIDKHGNPLNFEYNDEDLLMQVDEPISNRFLRFTYDDEAHLITVTDSISRTSQFGYNDLLHLTTITDTRDNVWAYEYTPLSGGEYVLSHVIDPDGRTVEQTTFDDFGRAIAQSHRGERWEIVYHDDDRRVITNGLGEQRTDIYDNRGLLIATADHNGKLQQFSLNGQHNRTFKEDRAGNPTYMAMTDLGYTSAITDALGHATHLQYDERGNRTQLTKPNGDSTFYGYDDQNNLITQKNKLGTVSYTYNTYGQPTSRTDDQGTLYYAYDSIGQLTVITNTSGLTTSFGYDAIGRLITTTNTLGQVTVNEYDASDNLIQVTKNDLPGQPQNYQNAYNLITQHTYDGAGNKTSMTDTLGRTTLYLYDEAGRLTGEVDNYDGVTPLDTLCSDASDFSPEYNICTITEYDEAGRVIATIDTLGRISRTFYDELGQVVGTIQNWSGSITDTDDLATCLSLPSNRDEDICSLHGYDYNDSVGYGRVTTDTVGNLNRTFYDEANRVKGIILNWDGQTTLEDCATLPAERDQNICTQFAYNSMGMTVIMTDTLGRMTRTFVDSMNRVQATVTNWNPATLTEPADCLLSLDKTRDENICVLTSYNEAGQPSIQTNALGQQTLTVYDSLARPFMQVKNWDGTPIDSEDDCQFPPVESDTNVCTVTYYDALGRREASKDASGALTTFTYDDLGRPTKTRYLDGQPVQASSEYNALGQPTTITDPEGNKRTIIYDSLLRPMTTISQEGVIRTTAFDAAGQPLTITNNLGQVTTNSYDKLGRLITKRDAEDNVTRYEYDVLGNQVAVIDAASVRTTYEYDDLQRLVRVIENDTGGSQTDDSNVVTEYSYDAGGNVLSVVNARHFTSTHTIYDKLNRPISVMDALGNTTRYQYNLLGLTTVMTDANGAATLYEYDGLNRLTQITYVTDNEVVTYEYGVLGNRTAMTDSLGVTTYGYDDLSRLTQVTNPSQQTVSYGYDLVGNRTSLTYPDDIIPYRGKSVTYTYNGDYRLRQVTDWNTDVTTYAYDEIGRLITTTLPNGVTAIKQYDDANRLTNLRYVAADDSLLAEYDYQLDAIGNRQAVTETLLTPEIVSAVEAFIERNGLLVIEAENGQETASTDPHQWLLQTAQSGYGGEGYLRVMPDVGTIYDLSELSDSPHQDYNINITNPDDYTVWVRAQAPDAASDSVHVGLNGQVAIDATRLTAFTQDWSWSNLTMNNSASELSLDSGTSTLDIWAREDGLRVDRLLLTNDPSYVPTGIGPAESPYQAIISPSVLTSHVIDYTYDDLYRLTDAVYSGAITATYQYAYDEVGNMTTYTETEGTQTTHVERTFDSANRLQTSFSDEAGTTTYEYDQNGNLTLVTPSAGSPQHYSYNQRHLMTSSRLGTQMQAEFVYDGDGNRVQQVDHTGGAAVTTTYVNDTVGLAQVLVADNGTTTILNLWGLDLIAQDDGQTVRVLLADALGSVRQEMVGQNVETTTTYSPYGNQLVQKGTSGTTYGYTGEQQDSTTGLLYLRARYYNPALRAFMGRDKWSGNMRKPQSMNGWSYVENNPVNLTDPTGKFPEYCKESSNSEEEYINCVINSYPGISPPWEFAQSVGSLHQQAYGASLGIVPLAKTIHQSELDSIKGDPGCYYGPVPYRAPGYLEGAALFGGSLIGIVTNFQSVYDFATMEGQFFTNESYHVSDTTLGVEGAGYAGLILGFRSWENINEYSGWGGYWSVGVSSDLVPNSPIDVGIGTDGFWGVQDPTIRGILGAVSIGVGHSIFPVFPAVGIGETWPLGSLKPYANDDGTVNVGLLSRDIASGKGWNALSGQQWPEWLRTTNYPRATAAFSSMHYSDIYQEIHRDSN